MEVLEELCYELEDMLEPIVKKGDISPTELDNVKDAVKSIYYIETIKAMKEYGNSNDYSYNGNSYRGSYRYDNMRGSYDDGYSERRGRDSRGRYTSRDNYSRHDEKEQMIERLERKLDMAKSEAERQAINDMIRELER